MSGLHVYPIVEGHGEVEAVRILFGRIWRELVGRDDLHVLRPQRMPRSKIVKVSELRRAIELGRRKLNEVSAIARLVIVLFDADNDRPCKIAPDIRSELGDCGVDLSIVVANAEYETWFVCAADSLGDYLSVIDLPTAPESSRTRKRWIELHMRTGTYSETVDQPKLTSKMDLQVCRGRCPSFDKLCREFESRNT